MRPDTRVKGNCDRQALMFGRRLGWRQRGDGADRGLGPPNAMWLRWRSWRWLGGQLTSQGVTAWTAPMGRKSLWLVASVGPRLLRGLRNGIGRFFFYRAHMP